MKKYMQMRADLEVLLLFYSLKFIYSERATKFLRNLPLTFDYSTYGQKLGEDFAKIFWPSQNI